MDEIQLLDPTGDELVDRMLRGLVGVFEAAFPKRVRGYYVEGSHASDTAVAASDLDLTIVFKGSFQASHDNDEEERERAARLTASYSAASVVECDAEIVDEEGLRRGVYPAFKLASRLVYGDDVRDEVLLLPLDEWTRQRMHAACFLIVRLFERPCPLRLPIDYPNPVGEFYGYDHRPTRLPDGRTVPTTRDLIRVIGWAATALVALQAGRYVARKRDCHVLYRNCIGDEWTALLDDIDTRCRGEWGYLVPDDPHRRRELRDICARALGFENHVLRLHRQFVRQELREGTREARLGALWLLARVPYQDEAILDAVRALAGSDGEPDEELHGAAREALGAMQGQERMMEVGTV